MLSRTRKIRKINGLTVLTIFAAYFGAYTLAADPSYAEGAQQDTPLLDQASIEVGQTRFAQNCSYCHGAEGSGGKHKRLQCRGFENDYLFDIISNGLESGSFFMPPWDHFSEKQRWELIAYIQSLNELETCE
jgi:mono/diheme cytochrome c family protein